MLSNLNTSTEEEDLQVVSDNMKEYVSTENETALKVITKKLNQRPGLIGILFPNEIKKKYDELTIQKMTDLFKAREDMLAVYTNTQIELARKASAKMIESRIMRYDSELSKQGMQIKADLNEFVRIKLNEISCSSEKTNISFGKRRARQMEDAEKYKSDKFYYDRLKQNLEKEASIFFDMNEALLEAFKDALQNKIKDH